MPARFCPQCGSPTQPAAKFCAECGSALAGAGPVVASAPVLRPTMLGGIVLSGFLVAGLGIWAAILTPDAPAPGPGQRAMPRGTAPAAMPENPHQLPDEISRMVGELATRAESEPENVDLWVHLGEVYYRTAQFDPAYRPKALAAFDHVLARDQNRIEAIRGKGNIFYDQQKAPQAIEHFERFLKLQPGDSSVRTDLATMYLTDGQRERAMALYRAVIADDPEFMQAHYNLAAALHGDGEIEGAVAELRIARGLAADEATRQRIDALIARLSGEEAQPQPPTAPPAAAPAATSEGTPYQAAVEAALRGYDIMGPRIESFEWTGPGTARVLMRSFPMDAMPPMAREKFDTRIREMTATAAAMHPVDGDRSVALVDAESGRVMATIEP